MIIYGLIIHTLKNENWFFFLGTKKWKIIYFHQLGNQVNHIKETNSATKLLFGKSYLVIKPSQSNIKWIKNTGCHIFKENFRIATKSKSTAKWCGIFTTKHLIIKFSHPTSFRPTFAENEIVFVAINFWLSLNLSVRLNCQSQI